MDVEFPHEFPSDQFMVTLLNMIVIDICEPSIGTKANHVSSK